MQNIQTKTKRKINLNIETDNSLLYHHVLIKVEKRLEQFWDVTMSSFGNEFDKLYTIKNLDQFKNFMSRIISKQVLSMAEYDKLYKMSNKGMITDEEKIDNLIELSFWIPELFSSIHNRNRKKNIRLIVDMMKSAPDGFNKPKGLPPKELEKKVFISKIKNAKEKLVKSNPPKKISISAVARELGYRPTRRQSFVDKLNFHKLKFDEI